MLQTAFPDRTQTQNSNGRARLLLALATLLAGAAFGAPAATARDLVTYSSDASPGTIVINASERRLYLVVGDGVAVSYPVAVPKRGKEWAGVTSISAKYVRPDWIPPSDVKQDHPELPNYIPGGSPHNPMGVRALALGEGQVAIHGTTNKMRRSIGTAASYGCIRMLNEDIVDLYERVNVGAPVVMNP
jgi:lipoprotein-anchoring transpeptidase ErfK/SrfK